jgi:hypothetical protein
MAILWRFRNSILVMGEVVIPTPNPQPKEPGLRIHFVWPLPFDLSCIGDPTRSLRSRQNSCQGHWDAQTSSPRYGVVLEEEEDDYDYYYYYYYYYYCLAAAFLIITSLLLLK